MSKKLPGKSACGASKAPMRGLGEPSLETRQKRNKARAKEGCDRGGKGTKGQGGGENTYLVKARWTGTKEIVSQNGNPPGLYTGNSFDCSI